MRLDLATPAEPLRFAAQPAKIRDLLLSTDGTRLTTISEKGALRFFDVEDGRLLAEYPEELPISLRERNLRCLTNPDDTLLHCADCVLRQGAECLSSRVRTFAVRSGQLLSTIRHPTPLRDFVPLSGDGLAFLVAKEAPLFWNARSGQPLPRPPGDPDCVIPDIPKDPGFYTYPRGLLSPDRGLMIVFQPLPEPRLCVFDAAARRLLRTVDLRSAIAPLWDKYVKKRHAMVLEALTYDGRSALIDVTAYESALFLVDTESGKRIASFPEGKLLNTLSLPEGKLLNTLADGRLIVASDVRYVDDPHASTYTERYRVSQIDQHGKVTPFLRAHLDEYEDIPVAISEDGRRAIHAPRQHRLPPHDEEPLGSLGIPPPAVPKPTRMLISLRDASASMPTVGWLPLRTHWDPGDHLAFVGESLVRISRDFDVERYGGAEPKLVYAIAPQRYKLSALAWTDCGLTLAEADKHRDRRLCMNLDPKTARFARTRSATDTIRDLEYRIRVEPEDSPLGLLSLPPTTFVLSSAFDEKQSLAALHVVEGEAHKLLLYDLVAREERWRGDVSAGANTLSFVTDPPRLLALTGRPEILVLDTQTLTSVRHPLPLYGAEFMVFNRDEDVAIVANQSAELALVNVRSGALLAYMQLDVDESGEMGAVVTDAENHLEVVGALQHPWRFVACRVGDKPLPFKACLERRRGSDLLQRIAQYTFSFGIPSGPQRPKAAEGSKR